MKKLLSLIIVTIMLLVTMSISVKVQALEIEDPGAEMEVQKVEIVNPTTSGNYQTGQEITFVVTFNGNIENVFSSNTLSIKFSESNTVRTLTNGTVSQNIITYKYTLTAEDKGSLQLDKFIGVKAAGGSDVGSTGDFDSSIEITANKTTTPTPSTGESDVTWADGSKFKFELVEKATGVYNLNITGIDQSGVYYAVITRDTKAPNIPEKGEIPSGSTSFSFTDDSSAIPFNEYIEKNGNMYIWVYQSKRIGTEQDVTNKCIVNGKNIERPALKAIGSRMRAYFSKDNTTAFLWEPYKDNRTINVRIGRVTDKNILKSIKNGEAGCLTRLLTYAKTSNSIYTGTIPLGTSKGITEGMELIDDEYYYAYMELDDKNGTYYPVEDVSLYQACIDQTYDIRALYNYLSNEFVWNIPEDDYFSDFSNAKAYIQDFVIDSEQTERNNLVVAVDNIKSNNAKKHKFFYYISNEQGNLPNYDSNLWRVANKSIINAETGICQIYTENIYELPYINDLDLSKPIYISIYEVISDDEITSDTISGEYRLMLERKQITFLQVDDDPGSGEEPGDDPGINIDPNDPDDPGKPDPGKEDPTVSGGKIPQTGVESFLIVIIMGTVITAIVAGIKYKKYNIKY